MKITATAASKRTGHFHVIVDQKSEVHELKMAGDGSATFAIYTDNLSLSGHYRFHFTIPAADISRLAEMTEIVSLRKQVKKLQSEIKRLSE